MARIDYFFTPLSAWTYLAGARLEEIAARHGATIAYRPVDLGAVGVRTGGVPLRDRHSSRQAYREQDLLRTARRLGMAFNLRPAFFPTNAAPAAYAIIAAAREGGGDTGALCRALLRAAWAEEKDIAEDEVICAALAGAGFDPGLADRGLFTAADAYVANTEEAIARGAFGSPFYIVAETDERFWGQDRLEDLDRYLAATPA